MINKAYSSPYERAEDFANRLGIRLPIPVAPMAGACPPSLSIAVANAGGLGTCGALMVKPDEIGAWSAEFREGSQGEFQINLWIPDVPPRRDFELEKRQWEFLAMWGPPVPAGAGDAALPDFEAQYVRAANAPNAPSPAPYPVQRGLTRAMREAAQKAGDADGMQL